MQPPGMLDLFWTFRRGTLRCVLTFAAIFALFLGGTLLLEIPLAPWLRSFGLWSTLTGDWQGEVRTPDGRLSVVYIEIRGDVLKPGARGPQRSYIHGLARWCDARGRIWDYEIWGNPDNWRGTRFHLSTRGTVSRESGFGLGNLRGEWSGDEIRAIGVLVPHPRTATAQATRTAMPDVAPPEVQYTLRRGSEEEFLAACEAEG